MTIQEAGRLNAACFNLGLAALGLNASPLDAEDVKLVKGAELADMLEATRLVKEADEAQVPVDGKRHITMTCDPRLLAALYVACNYRYGECVRVDGVSVVVCRTADIEEEDDG